MSFIVVLLPRTNTNDQCYEFIYSMNERLPMYYGFQVVNCFAVIVTFEKTKKHIQTEVKN